MTAEAPGSPVDLSSMIRIALAEAVEQSPERHLGFFVQPGVTARTVDEPALADLLRELVNGIVSSATMSKFPTLMFDELAVRQPSFYALTLVAAADDSMKLQIPERARLLATALGVHLWEVPRMLGDAASLCFALEVA
jgi:hypothetical protein